MRLELSGPPTHMGVGMGLVIVKPWRNGYKAEEEVLGRESSKKSIMCCIVS